MPLGNRLTKSPDPLPVEALAKYVEASNDIVSMGVTSVLMKLLGFVDPLPAPGDAASWGVDEWVAYGRRNGMTTVQKVKHGTMISHDMAPRICVVPSGTPSDVRAGMNCAAEFRRNHRVAVSSLKFFFVPFIKAVIQNGLRVDGRVPTLPELVKASAAATAADFDRLTAIGIPGLKEAISEEVEVNVIKAYNAMTYLAGVSDPPCSYPEVIMRSYESLGLDTVTRDRAGMLSKRIGQAFRFKEKLMLPSAMSLVLDAIVEQAAEHKDKVAMEKALKRIERIDAAKQVDDKTSPAVAIAGAAAKLRAELLDKVTRFGHDISQMQMRFEKVKDEVQGLDIHDIEAVLLAQAHRADKAEDAAEELRTSTQAKVAALEAIAKIVDVDPASDDFEAVVVGKVKALTASSAVRDKFVAFASKVHDKLSTKDFLAIAAAITDLLPEAEKIALSGGEEA